MAHPITYVPSYSFSGWQANNPSRPLPGPQVDNELANASIASAEAVRAIRDVRRADGRLANYIVTKDSLSREVWADVGTAIEALEPYKNLGAVEVKRMPLVSNGSTTTFTLSPKPYENEAVFVTINGTELSYGSGFSVNDGVLTLTAPAPVGNPVGEIVWHAVAPLISGLPPELVYWDDIQSRPGTIAGYGIVDAYTKAQVNALIAAIPVGDGGDGGTGTGEVTAVQFNALTQRVDGIDARLADVEDGNTGEEEGPTAAALKQPLLYTKTDALRETGLFEASGGVFAKAQHLQESATPFNASTTRMNYIADHLRVIVEGSTLNGPHNATVGHGIHMSKENYGTGNAKSGEIDAIYINMYQDSPNGTRADGAGILIDNHIRVSTGFMAGVEGMQRVINDSGTQTHQVGYQIGVADTLTADPLVVGAQLTAYAGVSDYGLIIGSDNAGGGGGGGYFQYPLQIHNGGREIVRVDAAGNVRLGNTVGPGAKMSLRVSEVGNFGILNDAESQEVMQLTQGGNLTIAGKLTADSLSVSNFAPTTINMSGSITAGSLASNGNAAVAGTLTAGAITADARITGANVYAKNYLFMDAVTRASQPNSGGVILFEAGTGDIVWHNGTQWRRATSVAA